MDEAKTLSPLRHHHAMEHRATPRALATLYMVAVCRAQSGRAIAVNRVAWAAKGHHHGPATVGLAQVDHCGLGLL
jgi:hypothetical protein